MARPTIHSVRSGVAVRGLNKSGLGANQNLKRTILQSTYAQTGDPALLTALNQQHKAVERHKAALDHVDSRRRPKKRRGARKDFRTPEGFNQCGLNIGRSYASKAGARMEAKKVGFPDVMRHPATINLCILSVWDSLKLAADTERKQLRKVLSDLSHGAQVEGMFSFVIHKASYLATMFPMEEWPQGFDPDARPNELFVLFHMHCDVSDPYLTKRQVRKLLADAYPGKNRVCVRKIIPEKEDEDGQKTHGGQGYLEYSAQEKTEVNTDRPEDREEEVSAYARLMDTWSKRNRSFSMGKPLSVTGVVIDEDRVKQLELIERLMWIKKHKSGEAYAEWFLHTWMSGLAKVTQQPQIWPQLGTTTVGRFLQALALVKNWCSLDDPEAPCFFDYMETQLE